MAVTTALIIQAQAAAERLMLDRCTVTRQSGELVEDPETGREGYASQTVYSGRCKVQTYEAYEATPEAGGHTYTKQRYRVDVPVSAGPFTAGDVVTVVGYRHPFRVVGEMDKTHLSAQRLSVDMIVR